MSTIQQKLLNWYSKNQEISSKSEMLNRNLNLFSQIKKGLKDGVFDKEKTIDFETGAGICILSDGKMPLCIITCKHCAFNDKGFAIPIQAISSSNIFESLLVDINPTTYDYIDINKEFSYKHRGIAYKQTSKNKFVELNLHDLTLIIKKGKEYAEQVKKILQSWLNNSPTYTELYEMLYDLNNQKFDNKRLKQVKKIQDINPLIRSVKMNGKIQFSRVFDYRYNLIYETESTPVEINFFDTNPFYTNALTAILPDNYYDKIGKRQLFNPKSNDNNYISQNSNGGRSGSIAHFYIKGLNCYNDNKSYEFLGFYRGNIKFQDNVINMKKYPLNANWAVLYTQACRELYGEDYKINYKIFDPAIKYYFENEFIQGGLFAIITKEVLDFWIDRLG
jgi:hypothetical protein